MNTSALLKSVMDYYPEQTPKQIVSIVKQLRFGLVGIEQEILSAGVEKQSNGASQAHATNRIDALKARYKDKIPANPSSLIGQEKITCAVCGKKYARLTEPHIKKHDLSVEEYKLLFGYSDDEKLSALDQRVWPGTKKIAETPLPEVQPPADTSKDNALAVESPPSFEAKLETA